MTLSLQRASTAVAVCAALLAVAGPASASTIKGTVVHRSAHARSFVVASAKGHLTAVHARRSPAIGRIVRVTARRLRNGTFAAVRVRAQGRRTRARIHGTVSFVDRRHGAFVVSARGASIRVRTRRTVSAARDSLPAVGTVVDVDTTLDDQGDLEADDVNEVGEDHNGIDLEGVVLAVDAANRTITVSADDDNESGQSVVVHVPATIDIATFATGQQVELTVTATADGFVLQGSSHDGDANEADDPSNEQGDHAAADQHGDTGDQGGSDD
ncbi:MAG: hypothetical protein QOJ35_178 [Solirubrobacteraceae bacterium]|jgi:hypothetical protein|nr:hypothetical protein [Solirubrobacteraceae bacterium]